MTRKMLSDALFVAFMIVSVPLVALGLVVVAHDVLLPRTEDTRVVFICAVDGDGFCGPDSPPVVVDLGELRYW